MAKTAVTKTAAKAKAAPPPPKAPPAKVATKAAATKAVAKPAAVATKAKAAPAKGKAAAPAKPVPVVTITMKQMGAAFAERHEMTKRDADAMLADVFGTVVDHLKAGERVRISGLGIIEVKNRPARMGRNPATGESIQIKASKKVAFRAAKELKEAI
ncbi:HU family DNA-binding protein [Acidisphaera sp. L21]|uniref:HU family DNA-binding protein n=1 Tax=Acidisphaera sp. L21 TaxID=1641851 RepID=UPI00131E8960|nr:HU family DNA-binding protein [Acidisphaera sp. L21]